MYPDNMPDRQDFEKEETFRRLFDELWSPLCGFARQYVKDAGAAQDLVTETFLKFWQLRERFGTDNNSRSFLYVTLRNACISYQRTEKRKQRRHEHWHYASTQLAAGSEYRQEAEAAAFRQIALQHLHREVASLPRKRRSIFQMAFIAGLKNEQIARILNLSRQTVKNHKRLAVRALQNALEGLSKQIQWTLC